MAKRNMSMPAKGAGYAGHSSFPAVPITQNNHRFYFTTIPVDDLFPYCFVVRREEEPEKGFQRTLSEARANDIARYLDSSLGSIPTNIVLSAQPEAELVYDNSSKTVKYRHTSKSFLVLDGQHRLYGYSKTRKRLRVPVAIYEGLTRKDEASLFIDINTNQRGVPSALLLDIKQVAENESAQESTLRQWFDKLNDDPQSPLAGYLSKTKSIAGKISRVTFNKAVSTIAKNPIVSKLPDDKQYILLRHYLKAAEESISTPSLIRRSAYFEAICEVFDDVMRLARANHGDYKLQSLQQVLGALKNIELAGIPTQGKSYITKSAIVPVIKEALSGQVDISEDLV